MNRGGFSWKRALGISAAKARLSRQIGIPLTRSGRQRKAGAALGCATYLFIMAIILIGLFLFQPSCDKDPASSSARCGAVCNDGSTTTATGSGACSHHGGVKKWIYCDD